MFGPLSEVRAHFELFSVFPSITPCAAFFLIGELIQDPHLQLVTSSSSSESFSSERDVMSLTKESSFLQKSNASCFEPNEFLFSKGGLNVVHHHKVEIRIILEFGERPIVMHND